VCPLRSGLLERDRGAQDGVLVMSTTTPPEVPNDNPAPDPFADIANPWQYLDACRELPVFDRPPCVTPWFTRVAGCPAAERDALVMQGKAVFGYRVETARDTLKKLAAENESPSQGAVSVVTDELIAEMIYHPGHDQPFGYLVHHFDKPEEPPQFVERLEVGKAVYSPPASRLAETGVVLFPSGIEEYGNDSVLTAALCSFIDRNVQLDDPIFTGLVAHYIKLTWVYDRLPLVPYLRALGDYEGGKTTFLTTVRHIVNRGIAAASATSAASIFRVLDRYRGTLVADEADFDARNTEWQQIQKLFLEGHTSGSFVLRAERNGDEPFDVAAYNAFGPKVLASRRPFADPALESRCLGKTFRIVDQLDSRIPLFPDDAFKHEAQSLRNQLLLWRFRHFRNVQANPREHLPGIGPRLNAVALMLSATATLPEERARVHDLVRGYSEAMRERRRASFEGAVGSAIVEEWVNRKAPDRFPLSAVTEKLQRTGEYERVTPERVSVTTRNVLGIKTLYVGGRSWVVAKGEEIVALARRYGIDVVAVAQQLGVPVPRIPFVPPRTT
jgi:hypothetical protein